MKPLNKKALKILRTNYPKGTLVELICMNDPYCSELSAGAVGRVTSVDDIGTIHIKWDCGSSLGVVYGEDLCRVIEENTRNTQTNQASRKPGDAPYE